MKGQGNGGRGGDGSCLSTIVLLLSPGEGEVDLLEGGVKDFAWEFLQVAVEGIGVEQFEDRSRQEGEGSAKWESKYVR